MGLGGQMVLWDEGFCRLLAERGYRVIRFDNRDIGKSTCLDAAGVPDVATLFAAVSGTATLDVSYTLSDMAADAAGLLDALDIDSAHVVGASMGGMISQTLALEHPSRVRTLTSIMSTTGDAALPPPSPEALAFLVVPAPSDRAGAIEHGVQMFRAIGSTGFEFEEEHVRKLASLSYDRGFNPAGVFRQLAAIVASGSRREALAKLAVPTLVIHGKVDPLIPVECGIATASAIPGARLELVEGMGHDMPIVLWPRLVDWIDAHASRAAHAAA
jgi:pimeloyl-ACP methyl ester carboxylesterase